MFHSRVCRCNDTATPTAPPRAVTPNMQNRNLAYREFFSGETSLCSKQANRRGVPPASRETHPLVNKVAAALHGTAVSRNNLHHWASGDVAASRVMPSISALAASTRTYCESARASLRSRSSAAHVILDSAAQRVENVCCRLARVFVAANLNFHGVGPRCKAFIHSEMPRNVSLDVCQIEMGGCPSIG